MPKSSANFLQTDDLPTRGGPITKTTGLFLLTISYKSLSLSKFSTLIPSFDLNLSKKQRSSSVFWTNSKSFACFSSWTLLNKASYVKYFKFKSNNFIKINSNLVFIIASILFSIVSFHK